MEISLSDIFVSSFEQILVSFKFDSPYGGYVDMKVRVDEEVQQSTDFQVRMSRDYE